MTSTLWYPENWRKVTVNRVCEAFELIKEAEMERFDEKSYFYRKMNGLSPADSDDDLDLTGDMFVLMASRNRRRKRMSAP